MVLCKAVHNLYLQSDITETERKLLLDDIRVNRPTEVLHRAHFEFEFTCYTYYFRLDQLGYYQRIAFLNDLILHHIKQLKPKNDENETRVTDTLT